MSQKVSTFQCKFVIVIVCSLWKINDKKTNYNSWIDQYESIALILLFITKFVIFVVVLQK